MIFKELDTIELVHDIKKHDLKKGDLGAIVNVYDNSGSYEVEFVASNGRTIALLTLTQDDIRPYISEQDYVPCWFNAPVSLGTVSGTTVTTEDISKGSEKVIIIDEFDMKTKSKEDRSQYHFVTP